MELTLPKIPTPEPSSRGTCNQISTTGHNVKRRYEAILCLGSTTPECHTSLLHVGEVFTLKSPLTLITFARCCL